MKTEKNSRAFIVGFAAILMGAISTVPLAVSSIFIPPMAAALEASVTAVSLFASISALAGMITSFLLGKLLKTFPFKALIVAGGIFSGLLMVTIGLSTSLPLIYAAAFLQGIGLIIAGAAMTQTVLSQWFMDKLGLMMSMILVFTMLLAAVLNAALAPVIVSAGYQTVALWLGIISAAVVVFLGLFIIVESPAKVGLKPYGYTEDAAAAAGAQYVPTGFTLKQAFKTAPFWAILFYMILTTVAAQAIGSQASNYYQAIGLDAATAGLVIAVNALMGIVFCLVAGILSDKKSPAFAASIVLGCAAVAFLLNFMWSGMGGAMIASVLFAGTSATSVFGSTMVTKLYGTKDAGSLLGFTNAAGNIGSLLGPILAASFFDKFGNYKIGFVIVGVLCIAAIVLANTAGSKKAEAQLKELEQAV